jgi:hypothetical protein
MDDVFDMVFLPHRGDGGVMFVAYECYLDDSKDGRQEIAYVCAGFYGTKKTWNRFNRAWDKQLKAEGIEYYKSSEFKSLTKQFARFKNLPEPHGREGARRVKQRLERIAYDSSGLHGVGVAVPKADYDAVLSHDSAELIFPKKYIYHRAFEWTLLKATELACKSKENRAIVFAHDDEDDFNELRDLYRSYKERNSKSAVYMCGFQPLNDKVSPALQIADMLANSVMGTTVGFITGREGAEYSDIFMNDRTKLYVWSRELGEKMLLREMAKRKILVPQSLIDAMAGYGVYPINQP